MIATIKPDGRNVRYLAHGVDPSWSADGSTIAFVRHPTTNQCDLFSMKANGSGIRRLTFTPNYCERSPGFSPGGGRIVFSRVNLRNDSKPDQIVVMRANGAHKRVVTEGVGPEWAPNGRHIVFQHIGISIIRPDGTHRQVGLASGTGAHYSADGRSIFFSHCPCVKPGVTKMGAFGGHPQPVKVASFYMPAPAPGGGCLLGVKLGPFTDNGRPANLYAVGRRCPLSGLLTNYDPPSVVEQPSWQPLP